MEIVRTGGCVVASPQSTGCQHMPARSHSERFRDRVNRGTYQAPGSRQSSMRGTHSRSDPTSARSDMQFMHGVFQSD